MKPIGVLLLNLGGPDSLQAVPRFMLNMFQDPDVFSFPLGRVTRPLFARTIVWLRAKKVQAAYARIGGRSPLLALTRAQGAALRATLRRRGVEAAVAPAMRHWRPLTGEALEELDRAGASERLVVVPLYPHYSLATTGSSLNELNRCLERRGRPRDYRLVEPYYAHPGYVEAWAERLREGLEAFSAEIRNRVEILFSAHGLPESFLERGDPYVDQVEATCEAVRQWFPGRVFHLAYQSRVGPARWIGPHVDQKLAELGRRGIEHLLVVPVSFVSDHIETLWEIDVHYRALAREAGIADFRRVRSLNASPTFINALADLVIAADRRGTDAEAPR